MAGKANKKTASLDKAVLKTYYFPYLNAQPSHPVYAYHFQSYACFTVKSFQYLCCAEISGKGAIRSFGILSITFSV